MSLQEIDLLCLLFEGPFSTLLPSRFDFRTAFVREDDHEKEKERRANMHIQQQAKGKENGSLNVNNNKNSNSNPTAWWVHVNEQKQSVWFERESNSRRSECQFIRGIHRQVEVCCIFFLLVNLVELSCSFLARKSGRSVEWSNPKNKSPIQHIHFHTSCCSHLLFFSLLFNGRLPFLRYSSLLVRLLH